MAVPLKVGLEMRDRRIALGLRQQDLADKIGMSRGYISMVEGGVEWTPSAEVLARWSKALGWEPDVLARRILDRSGDDALTGDMIQFIREQARTAIQDELLRALRDREGTLSLFVREAISDELAEAIVRAVDEIRNRETHIARELTEHYLVADAVIVRGEAHRPGIITSEDSAIELKSGPRKRVRAAERPQQVEH